MELIGHCYKGTLLPSRCLLIDLLGSSHLLLPVALGIRRLARVIATIYCFGCIRLFQDPSTLYTGSVGLPPEPGPYRDTIHSRV